MNMPKISLFHLFILQIESILESHHMTGHIHFWLHQALNFQRLFNLHEFVPACKKSVNSWDRVNHAIWLAESILAYISGTRFFPKYRIYAGTQQIINIFIIEQIQWKLITKFFFQFKKPIFGPFNKFLVIVSMQEISSIHKLTRTNFRVSWTKWPHPFLT